MPALRTVRALGGFRTGRPSGRPAVRRDCAGPSRPGERVIGRGMLAPPTKARSMEVLLRTPVAASANGGCVPETGVFLLVRCQRAPKTLRPRDREPAGISALSTTSRHDWQRHASLAS